MKILFKIIKNKAIDNKTTIKLMNALKLFFYLQIAQYRGNKCILTAIMRIFHAAKTFLVFDYHAWYLLSKCKHCIIINNIQFLMWTIIYYFQIRSCWIYLNVATNKKRQLYDYIRQKSFIILSETGVLTIFFYRCFNCTIYHALP